MKFSSVGMHFCRSSLLFLLLCFCFCLNFTQYKYCSQTCRQTTAEEKAARPGNISRAKSPGEKAAWLLTFRKTLRIGNFPGEPQNLMDAYRRSRALELRRRKCYQAVCTGRVCYCRKFSSFGMHFCRFSLLFLCFCSCLNFTQIKGEKAQEKAAW